MGRLIVYMEPLKMLDDDQLVITGGRMKFDVSTLDRYRTMSAEDKIEALKQALHMDEKPLGTLLAMMAILEPDRVEAIFEKIA